MAIKGVIFDLDGVIVTTDQLHYQAWAKMADKEKIYFNKEINNRLRGVSRLESLEIILEQAQRIYSEAEKQELMDYKNNRYVQLIQNLTPEDILPDVLEVLNTLKTWNYRIAIGSSSKNAKIILQQIGLLNTFDAIVDGTEITRSKPHPDVFLIAAQKLELKPTFCAVIEDAAAGIEAAKRAGMKAIAIGDAAKSNLADIRLNTIKDLLKLDELNNCD